MRAWNCRRTRRSARPWRRGAGATAISSLVAHAGLASGSLVELPFAFRERRFLALRHGDRHHGRAAAALLEVIRRAAA